VTVPLDAAHFRELVSGDRKGLLAGLVRAGLQLAEVPYALGVAWRNRRFDRGGREIIRVEVPVISVGNLTLGGTGKTPFVAWIARWLRHDSIRVAIVSRGYGATAGSRNDEALELEQRLPDVPHVQNRDRVAAARVAIDELDCQAIVLDDGFQHRRLARDLDIVLLDACEPFGWGHLVPRGYLREPPANLARAQVVALSRADMVDESRRRALRDQVASWAPSASWIETQHAPQCWLAASGKELPLDGLAGKRVAALAGIGNPLGFRHSLSTCRLEVVEFREFPDHHAYSRDDVQQIAAWADRLDVKAVVCTHKDLVKLGVDRLGSRPLWALVVGLEIVAGQSALEVHLRRATRLIAGREHSRPTE
jgi:tetraacyldisaccharide 4'-kinase